MATHTHTPHPVRPLTRCGADGVPYARTPGVERQIATALTLDEDQLIVRAQIANKEAPNHLQAECIVYLIRDYHRRGQAATVSALFGILLQRCEPLWRRRLGSLERSSFEEAYDECVAELTEAILELSSDRGDFLQVRFWLALDRRATSTFDRHVARQRRDARTVAIGPVASDDGDSPDTGVDLPATGLTAAELAECRAALATIEEPYRTAFVLRYYYGWPVEADDPHVPTVSRYFEKTSRTIRNYLQRAEQALTLWRGAHP